MTETLLTLLAFVVALGILIAVHEFGHFWVARRLGVKVLRFSIGFGKPFWRWQAKDGETEYAVATIPLGGYVKMLDEREGEVPEAEVHRAFNRQVLPKRFAIVLAGPVFNLLFAVVAYWLMFTTGVPGVKPLIGGVEPGSLAEQAGLQPDQEVVAVDGERTPTWGAAMEEILPHALRKEPVVLTVRSEGGGRREANLRLDRLEGELKAGGLPGRIGIDFYRPQLEPVIGEVVEGSPAERAGLRPGDRIEAIDGEPVPDWEALVEAVRASPGAPLEMTVQRDGQRVELQARPETRETEDGPVGRLGAGPKVDRDLLEGLRAEHRYGPVRAVGEAGAKTWEMTGLTLRMLWEMVRGRASTENISGPITIAVYAKASAMAGFAQFLSFLGIVSVSLGVLNLLPIPLLDGGHLLYYVIEAVTGRPVSEATQEIGQKIGIAIILGLMTLAFYNDLMRLVG